MSRPRLTFLPIPMRDGVSPSCVALPQKGPATVLEFLATHLQAVSKEEWHRRLQAGDVVDQAGAPIAPDQAFTPGARLFYYRHLDHEAELPFTEQVLYQDEHLLVADKPHFMPVTPSGKYVQQSLLVRLKRQLGLPELSPIHRIDRDTAGLVLFSVQQATRGAYQTLFRDRAIHKHYEAVAPYNPTLVLPMDYASRMQEAPQFFRMQEVPGAPNSLTRIELKGTHDDWALYQLSPVSGKRHQLRVHMAALGLPLRNDPFYPEVNDPPEGDYSRPLQLLARSLHFQDPLTGELRHFESTRQLQWPPPASTP